MQNSYDRAGHTMDLRPLFPCRQSVTLTELNHPSAPGLQAGEQSLAGFGLGLGH